MDVQKMIKEAVDGSQDAEIKVVKKDDGVRLTAIGTTPDLMFCMRFVLKDIRDNFAKIHGEKIADMFMEEIWNEYNAEKDGKGEQYRADRTKDLLGQLFGFDDLSRDFFDSLFKGDDVPKK